MERIIIKTEGYSVVETDNCSLEEIVEFVVRENYLHHQKSIPVNLSEEIEELIKEEQRLLSTSRFFVARDNKGRLIGCIRLHRWNHTSDLPISKFGIRVEEVFPKEKYPNIWHVGRFAIERNGYQVELSLFKVLILCAIEPIVNTSNSIMLAEFDIKLLSLLDKINISMKQLGIPQLHIGSETIPVYSNSLSLAHFHTLWRYDLDLLNKNLPN